MRVPLRGTRPPFFPPEPYRTSTCRGKRGIRLIRGNRCRGDILVALFTKTLPPKITKTEPRRGSMPRLAGSNKNPVGFPPHRQKQDAFATFVAVYNRSYRSYKTCNSISNHRGPIWLEKMDLHRNPQVHPTGKTRMLLLYQGVLNIFFFDFVAGCGQRLCLYIFE